MYEQLGLFENTPLTVNKCSSAKILQTLIEKNWKMKESDKDMILMLHEFEYELKGQKHFLKSSLIVKGQNMARTAMAKTVGLPLGIAAKLILEEKMKLTGLHLPIIPEIYEPVLEELALEGIRFTEEIS
jgi:saccharopine dehydrogenase (NADP+, L-glutamate forming)